MDDDENGSLGRGALKVLAVSVCLTSIGALAVKWWLGGSYSYPRDFLIALIITVVISLILGGVLFIEFLGRIALAYKAIERMDREGPITQTQAEQGPYTSTVSDADAQEIEGRLARIRIPAAAKLFLAVIGTPLTIWIGLSTGNWLFERGALVRSEARECQATPSQITGQKANNPSIGLALSGGGYRAAVMHAGVLAALDCIGVRVTHLSTVSGGSIIGAYYSLGGEPRAFLRATAAGRFNLKGDLSDIQNTFVWLFNPEFTRTHVQANLVNRVLFDDAKLGDTGANRRPLLMISTTDLIRGEAVGLSRDGTAYRPLPQLTPDGFGLVSPEPRFSDVDSTNFPKDQKIATLVAASGAVPLAFAPINISYGALQLELVDGGVFDNLGVTMLLDRHRRSLVNSDKAHDSWKLDVALVSDGGAPLSRSAMNSTLGQVERMMDIVYGNALAALKITGDLDIAVLRMSPDQLRAVKPKDRADRLAELAKQRGISSNQMAEKCWGDVEAFDRTSTLDDRPSEAEAVYELGECLVWWNKSTLETKIPNGATAP
jgi:predicted acylesterase/phospholipase RssA